MEVGQEGDSIPYCYTVTTRIGGDESHFNVSFIVRDKVTRQCPQTTAFLKKRQSRNGFEPRSLCLPAYTPYLWAKPAHVSGQRYIVQTVADVSLVKASG